MIGRSYGGAIAVDLALRYPDRVRALALLEGDVPSVSPTAAREVAEITARILAAAEADIATAAETLMREVLGDAGWEGLPEEVKGDPHREQPGARRRAPRRLPRGDRRRSSPRSTSPPLFVGADGISVRLRETARGAGRSDAVDQGRMGRRRPCDQPGHPVVLAFVDEVLARR